MAEENKGSAEAGSPEKIIEGSPNPNSFEGTEGELPKKEEPQKEEVDPEQHKELEKLLGTQSKELGELRKFFTDIAPILDKLDNNPEIVQAIVEGNITTELAKAALEGKVSITEAEIVTEAHKEVKKELGKKGYAGTSPEDVTKLVEDKAKELKDEFTQELKERDELATFESEVNEFMNNTPDFKEYAKDIDEWLDNHDVTDIRVAYYAVKGEISEKAAIKQANIDKAELEKSGALNMGGGTGKSVRIKGDANVLDNLIAGKSNPNVF